MEMRPFSARWSNAIDCQIPRKVLGVLEVCWKIRLQLGKLQQVQALASVVTAIVKGKNIEIPE